MAQQAVAEGISHILVTPHHKNGKYLNPKEAVQEATVYQRKVNRDAEEDKLKEMESKGMVVVRDVDKAAWQKAMQPAYEEFAKQFGKDKMDAIINTK